MYGLELVTIALRLALRLYCTLSHCLLTHVGVRRDNRHGGEDVEVSFVSQARFCVLAVLTNSLYNTHT